MNAEIPAKKLERVRKLLDLAAHPGTPQAEAESAMDTATALMAAYGIEMAMLADAGKVRDELSTWEIVIGSHYDIERISLLAVIAEAKNCRGVYWTHNPQPRPGQVVETGLKFQAVGYTSDLELVNLLYTSLWLQASTGMRKQPGKSRRSWLIGFTNRVGERLREMNKTAIGDAADTTTVTGRGVELVLFDRKSAVDREFERLHPRTGTGKNRKISNWDGFAAGQDAGNRADLGGTGVDNGGRRAINA